jgi:hypothetical protein
MRVSEKGRGKLSKVKRKDLLMSLLFEKGTNEEKEPLDRIRIMKGLFLLSQEAPRLAKLFNFEPYLYGAIDFDVYTELESLEKEGLAKTTNESSNDRWDRYLLTNRGISEAQRVEKRIPNTVRDEVARIKRYVTSKQTYELLKEIYAKYPSFAKKSVIRFR